MRKLVPLILLGCGFGGLFAQQPSPSPAASPRPESTHQTGSSKTQLAEVNFSDQAMQTVLQDLRTGLQNHSGQRLLSVFDASRMKGYLQVESQVAQLFDRYDTFHLHYRILETSTAGEKGTATVEMQLEADPRQDGAPSLRRDGQIRFELLDGEKGWKIVDFQPRDFLTP